MASLEFSDEENELDSHANRNRRVSEDDGGYRSDEAEEDRTGQNADNEEGSTGRRIDPSTSKKRVVRNPQPKLNAERIQGPKGVQTIEKYFEGFKFHGKGHEKSDLDKIMKRLEHWAHRLFPKYQFDDFLEKMETLGSKKNVQVYLKKYRLGMETPDADIIDLEDETGTEIGEQPAPEEAPVDEFDKLIAEQIEKQRRVTGEHEIQATSSVCAKPTGNVLGTAKPSEISEEIKARMEANRKLAIERKNARLKKIEEESKKRKLEESQDDSQVHQSPNALITNAVFGPEEHSEDVVSEKIQSPAVDATAMEVSSNRLDESGAAIQEPLEELTSYSGSFNKHSTSRDVLEDIESNPDKMKYSNVAKIYGSANKKSKDDPETLLTKEELQTEIDNAIEEIISRNAHKNQ